MKRWFSKLHSILKSPWNTQNYLQDGAQEPEWQPQHGTSQTLCGNVVHWLLLQNQRSPNVLKACTGYEDLLKWAGNTTKEDIRYSPQKHYFCVKRHSSTEALWLRTPFANYFFGPVREHPSMLLIADILEILLSEKINSLGTWDMLRALSAVEHNPSRDGYTTYLVSKPVWWRSQALFFHFLNALKNTSLSQLNSYQNFPRRRHIRKHLHWKLQLPIL